MTRSKLACLAALAGAMAAMTPALVLAQARGAAPAPARAPAPAAAPSAKGTYKLDPNAPLAFTSDAGGFDPVACTTPLNGRVDITQDRVRLRANTVTAFNTKIDGKCYQKISRVEAHGNVFYVTPLRTVRADNAIYDPNSSLVTFTGNVVAVQDKNVSTADQMVFNVDTDAAVLTGQVHGVLYPETREEAFAKADTNSDGRLDKAEFAKTLDSDERPMPDAHFNRLDVNHDGFISKDEFLNPPKKQDDGAAK